MRGVTGGATTPWGVAILGCGKMGQRHADAVARSPDFRLVAVSDTLPEVAGALASRMGVPAEPDLPAMLRRPDVQLVVVATPTAVHTEHTRAALEAGRHVLCEKPLATTAPEVRALSETAASAGRALVVGYLYRYVPAFRRIRAALVDGVLGEPHLAIMRIGGRGNHRVWKHQAELAGGAIFDMMSHMVDLALWFFGPAREARLLSNATLLPERVIGGEPQRVDAEDYAVGELILGDGVRCLVEADLASPSFMQYVEVHGANGSIFGSIVDGLPSLVFLKEAREGYASGLSRFDEPPANPIDEEWRGLAKELRDRSAAHWLDESRQAAEILERLRSPR